MEKHESFMEYICKSDVDLYSTDWLNVGSISDVALKKNLEVTFKEFYKTVTRRSKPLEISMT